jgi:pyridoxamine 5'-phosphate oxidase
MNRENDQIRALRESYERAFLSEEEIHPDPLQQFKLWFNAAMESQIFEVNAMTLATVNPEGQPSARTVLLKEIVEEGMIFYSNYESKKGQSIDKNDKVALLFFWKELEQQVRIEGTVEKIDHNHSLSYFHTRPKGSQIGAWASPQSQKVTRSDLEKRAAQVENDYSDKEQLPLPPFWGGYLVRPNYYEFWQGRKNRLHDRIVYEDAAGSWSRYRIAP